MVQEKKKLECENNECKRNFFSDSHVINNFESEPIFTDISQNEEDNETIGHSIQVVVSWQRNLVCDVRYS